MQVIGRDVVHATMGFQEASLQKKKDGCQAEKRKGLKDNRIW